MITDAWTGNPSFDFVSPAVAENVVNTRGSYTNAVVWDDVAGEFGETYDVYASRSPFVTASADSLTGVDVVALSVAEGTQEAYHDLTMPLSDRNTNWYYAVYRNGCGWKQSKVAAMTSAVNGTWLEVFRLLP